MGRLRLLGGAAAAVIAACAGYATAQEAPPLARVWVGDVPESAWTTPSRADAYVGRAPRDAAETRRLEAAMDHVLARYPDGGRRRGLRAVLGRSFQPVQQPPEAPVVGVFRMNEAPFAFGGACGSNGDSEYITAPAGWFDRPGQGDWLERAPELSLASAIGFRQVRAYCEDVAGIPSMLGGAGSGSPTRLALNGLGAGLGFYGLWDSPMRGGERWHYDSIATLLDESGAHAFSGEATYQAPVGLARRYGNLRRVDEPLFGVHEDQVADAGFWALLGASRRWEFLPGLYRTAPAGDTPGEVRRWLDEGLKASSDPARGLALTLPGLNWYGLVGHILIPEGGSENSLFSRSSWQGAMVRGRGATGCTPVELSLSQPFVELTVQVEAAASNCLAVRWSGPTRDLELPPSFSVVADAGMDADAMDGLHLSADQNWTDRLTIESGARSDEVELHRPAPIIRPGLVVEDVQSRRTVKSWEVVFKPDVTFADDVMTVALTSIHPDGEEHTRPMTLRLTVGPGAHEARQNLTGATVPEDGDPCTDQRQFTPNVARAYSIPVNNFHVVAIDPEDFSINGFFQAAGGPSLEARLIDCSRIQLALGLQGPGAAGQAFRGAENADSPASVCAGTSNELTNLGAQALAGATGANLSNLPGMERVQPRRIDFGLTARSPITGPGTYPADATAEYRDLQMEERNLQLPTSSYGEGTITVEHAGPGRLRVRYEARFEPQECSAYLAGTVSGTLETVTALPMVGMSRRALIQPRPIDLFGERIWMQMSAATRREMQSQPRRSAPESAGAPGAGGPGAAVGALRDPTQCRLSAEEVRRILQRYASQMPAQIRAQFLAELEADPDAARHMACIFQEAM